MNFLIFDIETTGLPKKRFASHDDLNNWPRIVSIAWSLCNEQNIAEETYDFLIRPDGFTIPDEATQIHGITNNKAWFSGVELKFALSKFIEAAEKSDFLVAHNISFDYPIVCAELIRCGLTSNLGNLIQICTMEESTLFCKIRNSSYSDYKYPTLIELVEKLFNIHSFNAHSALDDVIFTRKCFFELIDRKIIRIKKYQYPALNHKLQIEKQQLNRQLKYYSKKKTPKWNDILNKYLINSKDKLLAIDVYQWLSNVDMKVISDALKNINQAYRNKLNNLFRETEKLEADLTIDELNDSISNAFNTFKDNYKKKDVNAIVDYNYLMLSLVNCDWIDLAHTYINFYTESKCLYVSLSIPSKYSLNKTKEICYSYKRDCLYNMYYTTEEFSDIYRQMVCDYLTLLFSRFFYANSGDIIQIVRIKSRGKVPFTLSLNRSHFEAIDMKSIDTRSFISSLLTK